MLTKVFALFLLGALPATLHAQCPGCGAEKDEGNPIDDECTKVTVIFTQWAPGKCSVPEGETDCAATHNCRFTVTVSYTDQLSCEANYGRTYCVENVDANGTPTGGQICAPEQMPFPNPDGVKSYPIVCGRRESWTLRRYRLLYPPVIIAAPSATCKNCGG